MAWVKLAGKDLEFDKVDADDGFGEWLASKGADFLDKFIADEGLKLFAKSKARNMLFGSLQDTLEKQPTLLAAVREEVRFYVSHVGMLAAKLVDPAVPLNVVIVPRLFVREASQARLMKELGNAEALLDMKAGKDLTGYFIDQLNKQMDNALLQLVAKHKPVPTFENWFIFDADPSFEWQNEAEPHGHYVAVKSTSSDKLDKGILEEAKEQEEKLFVNLGKMSRSEIDALVTQWRAKLGA